MERGTGEIVQAGSESFGEDLSLGGPSPTEEIRRKKRNKSVSFALDDEGTTKKSKDDPSAKKYDSRVFRNSHMKKPKPNEPKCSKTASNELTIKRNESSSEDEITPELENLQIDPNQNNLTSLLDDMVPTSRKLKLKKKNLDRKLPEPVQTDMNSNVANDFDLKKVVKWTKKRWNKDKKGASIMSNQRTSVIVQDLPKTMSSVYQKQLADVFEKFGRIKRIGGYYYHAHILVWLPRPAETQPEKDDEAVFSTIIYFETEEAATKALDVVSFDGSSIRVSRPLPPSETTAVARCFSQLPVEDLRAIFGGAGALRSVRVGQRRSGHTAVAFLEFDGPVAVQRALALSGTAKINGKPVYVNKFEVRDKKDQ